MKLCVISNKTHSFVSKIEEKFHIPRFQIHEHEIQRINQIMKVEKEWIIETTFIEELSIIANQATLIVLVKDVEATKKILLSIKECFNLYQLSSQEKEFIHKYRGKIVLLKNKKEIKKFLIALEKDEKYWY